MARKGAGDRKYLIYLLIYSNKLSYLQLMTVLVYGSRLPKSHEQGYLKFWQKQKISVNEFIFRTCNFTKNELFLTYCYVINIAISKILCLFKLSNKDNGMLSFSFVLFSLMLTLTQNMYSS